ncbi:MAG: glycosyltransferase family 4 protein [Deltaproteobacteria bacterium]|nr:glycosyltransferase family 4 protein [Deltaproteobacteria bacterium]
MHPPEKKIRVVHYCNQLSIGGTERTMEIFCKYLDRTRFEVFVVSRIHRVKLTTRLRVELGARLGLRPARGKKLLWASMNVRATNFQTILGPDHVFFASDDNSLRHILLKLNPDILHVHYSGNAEAPTSDEEVLSRIPVTVTTNPFEKQNTAPAHRHVKKILFVSRWLLENRAQWASQDARAGVLYNPIEVPCTQSTLRTELGIPENAFVVGRVGRADPGIHDPIGLRAYRQIEDANTFFLALSPPDNMLRQAKALNLKNFISLPPKADDVFLSKFYNTIDVLAHSRRDGETFGCNIAEAMIHGTPVISHLTPFMNAQSEVIGDTGFVCAQDDWQDYAAKLALLKSDQQIRYELSSRSESRALEQFEARSLTHRLEKIYLELLAQSRN